jgi:hypothetical protein
VTVAFSKVHTAPNGAIRERNVQVSFRKLVEEMRANSKHPLWRFVREGDEAGAFTKAFVRPVYRGIYFSRAAFGLLTAKGPSEESKSWGEKLRTMMKSISDGQDAAMAVYAHRRAVARHEQIGRELDAFAKSGTVSAIDMAVAESLWGQRGAALDRRSRQLGLR